MPSSVLHFSNVTKLTAARPNRRPKAIVCPTVSPCDNVSLRRGSTLPRDSYKLMIAFPGNQWLNLAMIRVNHKGTRMDTPETRDTDGLGGVNEVVAHTKKVHAQGIGVISMRLAGEGQFTRPEDREAALKFTMNLDAVDAVTIGFKNTAEIDEAIDRMLNA